MQCSEFQQRWQLLLDERERPEFDAQLRDHAEHCSGCAELLDLQEQLFIGLAATRPSAPDDLADGTLARLHQSQQSYGRRRRAAALISVGLAVAVLLFLYPPAATVPPVGIGTTSAIVSVDPPSRVDFHPASSPEMPGEDRRSLDEDISAWLRDLWLRATAATQFGRMGLQPVEQFAEGFEPLASTLNVAINTLRRGMPAVRPDHESRSQQATPPQPPTDSQRMS